VSARHVGFDVIYSGIRLTPEQIVESAVEENADVIGASVLSGSHLELADQLMDGLRQAGAADDVVVVFGGIIPRDDFAALKAKGIARVFTPADYELIDIMEQIVTTWGSPTSFAPNSATAMFASAPRPSRP
jgi:(2R)-ethylmalonyl-CoA mutase